MPLLILLSLVTTSPSSASTLRTQDGLSLQASLPGALSDLRLGGKSVSRAEGGLSLIDPRSGAPPEVGRFSLSARADQEARRIVIAGEVTAAGDRETVCMLQARIPVGQEGWLFWDDMTRSRPIRAGEAFVQSVYPLLCVTDETKQTGLAVGLDPDPLQPAALSYDPALKCVIVNWFLGFTPLARPEFRMKAPFRIEVYRVLPKWAFRSALDGYYRFHPKQFDWRARHEGLWLFASASESLPNPQHYAYDEGGPPPAPDIPRGIRTFPYSCTGDLIIPLPPEWGQPKTYDEMTERLARWEKLPRLTGWDELSDYVVDETVAHSGQSSLRLDALEAPGVKEVRQVLDLNQKATDPVTVSAWTKAQAVTGDQDPNYGLWLDMEMADGENQFGKVAPAAIGTHDWQELRLTVGADKPIQQIRLYLLFRNTHTGRAWFDDLIVTAASEPERNLVTNGAFEYTGPPPQSVLLRDNVVFDENDHLRYASDTWGGADVPPASPINWLRYILLVNPDQKNPEGRPTASDRDFAMYDRYFEQYPELAGAYLDGTSGCCTTTFDYRRDHFPCFRDPFQYLGAAYRPCASGTASMIRWVQAFRERYPGKLAFGNVWASTRMFPMCMALDVPGYESSRWYDLDYMDYYRAAAYHKPGLLLNYFRIGQQLDTREGGERFFRYATAYGLFPSIGRFTDEAYEKFGDLQHLYVPIVKRLFRAGWEPITYAECSDPNVRVQRFGTTLPMYFTLLNPGPVPREVELTLEAKALGIAGGLDVVEVISGRSWMCGASSRPRLGPVVLGPDDLAVIALLRRPMSPGPWLRERAAEVLQGAAYVHAQTPPTSAAAELAGAVRAVDAKASPREEAGMVHSVRADLARLRAEATSLPDDLKRRSYLRDLAQAERLLTESLAVERGCEDPPSALIAPLDETVTLQATSTPDGRRCGPRAVWPGRLVELPDLPDLPSPARRESFTVTCPPERMATVAYESDFVDASGRRARVLRRSYVFFAPICELTAQVDLGASGITVRVRNSEKRKRGFAVALTPPEGLTLTPTTANLSPAPGAAKTVSAKIAYDAGLASGTYPVKVTVRTPEGTIAEETTVPVTYVLPLALGNLALASAGAEVAVDSFFYAYSAKPVNDGVVLPVNTPFNEAAWASGEAPEDHWAEVQWPQPQSVGRIVIYWNVENDTVWTARHFLVQAREGEGWKILADVTRTESEPVTECAFPPVVTQAIRVLQPKGDGPQTRPNLMWVREVAVYGQ